MEPTKARLDKSLCTLISMGRILTALMNSDHKMLTPAALADLGLVISKEADAALHLLHLDNGGNDEQ